MSYPCGVGWWRYLNGYITKIVIAVSAVSMAISFLSWFSAGLPSSLFFFIFSISGGIHIHDSQNMINKAWLTLDFFIVWLSITSAALDNCIIVSIVC